MKTTAPAAQHRNGAQAQQLEAIARRHMRLETLATRGSDRLDFHEVGVWEIQAALHAAYEAGRASTRVG